MLDSDAAAYSLMKVFLHRKSTDLYLEQQKTKALLKVCEEQKAEILRLRVENERLRRGVG